MHHAYILPGRGPFRCTDPSNHARRADLAIRRSASDRNHDAALMARQPSERAIRRRRTARATATTAPPLWRGCLPMGGRAGRGLLLVGRGGAAEGVRGVVRCRALTEKQHQRSADCGSLTPATSPNPVSKLPREGCWAGQRQGGAYRAAPPSEGCLLPVQKVVSAPHRLCRQLLRRAVRALGASSVPLDAKVSPLVLFSLTIPPGGI